jgi:hypothetical protein
MGEYFRRWSLSVSFITERNEENIFLARNFIFYGWNAAFSLSYPMKEVYVYVHPPSDSASNINFTDFNLQIWVKIDGSTMLHNTPVSW